MNLRKYIAEVLKRDTVNLSDLLDKRNLSMMINSRILIRASKYPGQIVKIMFSKQSLGERGQKLLVRGHKTRTKDYFVCTVFHSGSDITVQCYHPLTSKIFRCYITILSLHQWYRQEYEDLHPEALLSSLARIQLTADTQQTLQKEGVLDADDFLSVSTVNDDESEVAKHIHLDILKKEHMKLLYSWAVDRIVVDKRHGKFQVMFMNQYIKSNKLSLIIKLQALWRRNAVQKIMSRVLDKFMIKVRVSARGPEFYYLNLNTGASNWQKPPLMGRYDLPSDPEYIWRKMKYFDRSSGSYTDHFVNPFTGRFSHLSVDRAVRLLQNLVRKHQLWVNQLSISEVCNFNSTYPFD